MAGAGSNSSTSNLAAATDEELIELMFVTLEEFVSERAQRDGLRRSYAEYEAWLRTQDWYTSSSPGWLDGSDRMKQG